VEGAGSSEAVEGSKGAARLEALSPLGLGGIVEKSREVGLVEKREGAVADSEEGSVSY
jgi:hypothetical protein